MKLELMKVTPDQAATWLRNSGDVGNRRLAQARVTFYREEIDAGRWRLTPSQGIAITRDGMIVDGQHRLAAVVEHGAPVEFVVDLDADPNAFSVIDAGKSRTGSDVLKIAGYGNVSILHAAARLLYLIDDYQTGDRSWGSVRTQQISHARMLEYLDSDDGRIVQQSLNVGHRLSIAWGRYGARTPTNVATAILLRDPAVPEDLRVEFTERCIDGAMLAPGSPILALRRYFIGETGWVQQQQTQRALIGVASIIKAYNAWVLGESVRVTSFKIDSEEFPRPARRNAVLSNARAIAREQRAAAREAAGA